MACVRVNLEKDMERAASLIRNCSSRELLMEKANCSKKTLERILRDKRHPVTAKTLYAILEYGPLIQKGTPQKETA